MTVRYQLQERYNVPTMAKMTWLASGKCASSILDLHVSEAFKFLLMARNEHAKIPYQNSLWATPLLARQNDYRVLAAGKTIRAPQYLSEYTSEIGQGNIFSVCGRSEVQARRYLFFNRYPANVPEKSSKKRLQELSWGGRLSTQKTNKVTNTWTKGQLTDSLCTSANSNHCPENIGIKFVPLRHHLILPRRSRQYYRFRIDQRQSKEENVWSRTWRTIIANIQA